MWQYVSCIKCFPAGGAGEYQKLLLDREITITGSAVHEFGYEDIVKGSGYISCQCCGNTEIELGTVYAAEMGITLFSQIDRYTLEDAKVELFYHFKLADGSYKKIPMGVFEAIEANRLA